MLINICLSFLMFHTPTWLIWFYSCWVHDLGDRMFCVLSGLDYLYTTFLKGWRYRENRKFEILTPRYWSITSIVPTSVHYIDSVRNNEWKCPSWQVRSNLMEPRIFRTFNLKDPQKRHCGFDWWFELWNPGWISRGSDFLGARKWTQIGNVSKK